MVEVRAFLFLLFVINCVSTEEPHCSKFDFEEKILEKLVRMEFNEKQKEVDFERIQSDVTEKLQKMESLSTNVKNKVEETVALVAENTTKVLSDLEQKFSNLEKQIMDKLHTIQDKTQTVVFKARLRSNIIVTSGQTIVYPVVMFNYGNGYDSSTGVFTSPVNGTYMFDIVLCPHNDKYVNVYIVVDDEQTTVITFFGNDGHTCSSANAVVVLEAKQQIKVKVGSYASSAQIFHDSYRWNTFSGSLIHM